MSKKLSGWSEHMDEWVAGRFGAECYGGADRRELKVALVAALLRVKKLERKLWKARRRLAKARI